mmetsp:Transcript_8142/g.20080  ORF Transcript_8142/g.20080 Transcript_8142/m.20080 type:complete len:431 (-) Transcript_8142:343-1635(-)
MRADSLLQLVDFRGIARSNPLDSLRRRRLHHPSQVQPVRCDTRIAPDALEPALSGIRKIPEILLCGRKLSEQVQQMLLAQHLHATRSLRLNGSGATVGHPQRLHLTEQRPRVHLPHLVGLQHHVGLASNKDVDSRASISLRNHSLAGQEQPLYNVLFEAAQEILWKPVEKRHFAEIPLLKLHVASVLDHGVFEALELLGVFLQRLDQHCAIEFLADAHAQCLDSRVSFSGETQQSHLPEARRPRNSPNILRPNQHLHRALVQDEHRVALVMLSDHLHPFREKVVHHRTGDARQKPPRAIGEERQIVQGSGLHKLSSGTCLRARQTGKLCSLRRENGQSFQESRSVQHEGVHDCSSLHGGGALHAQAQDTSLPETLSILEFSHMLLVDGHLDPSADNRIKGGRVIILQVTLPTDLLPSKIHLVLQIARKHL